MCQYDHHIKIRLAPGSDVPQFRFSLPDESHALIASSSDRHSITCTLRRLCQWAIVCNECSLCQTIVAGRFRKDDRYSVLMVHSDFCNSRSVYAKGTWLVAAGGLSGGADRSRRGRCKSSSVAGAGRWSLPPSTKENKAKKTNSVSHSPFENRFNVSTPHRHRREHSDSGQAGNGKTPCHRATTLGSTKPRQMSASSGAAPSRLSKRSSSQAIR